MRCSRKRRSRHRWRQSGVSISDRRLWRDPDRGRVAGVCAGLAHYFGAGTTMVRFLAVTALIFVPQVTLIAYLLAAVFLPTREDVLAQNREDDAQAETATDAGVERERERQREFDRRLRENDAAESLDDRRRVVRRARERLSAIERRIQDLEAYVTSRRYDLNRELGKL